MRYFLLLILTCFTCCCYAINPFDLKGKYVVFSPTTWGNDLIQYPNVYNKKTIKGKGFRNSNQSSIQPYGKKIFVEDVQVTKEPVLYPFLYFVCKIEDERFTLAYRLNKYDYPSDELRIFVHPSYGQKFVEVSYSDITDVCIEAFTVDYLDSLETILKQTKKYALKQFGGNYEVDMNFYTANVDKKERYVSSLATPLSFVKLDFGHDYTGRNATEPVFNNIRDYPKKSRNLQNTLCAVYTDGQDLFYLHLNAALDNNVLIDEEKYLKICREKYADCELEQLLQSYQGKEIHMKLAKAENAYISGSMLECGGICEGVYYYNEADFFKLEDIVLRPQSNKDSIYLNMYYQLADITGTEENKERTLYIPVSKNWKNELELRTDYLERVRLERLAEEEASLRREKELAQEEAEYRSSLIKKFGRNNAQLIMDGEVRVGFTKAMCEESWGSPIHINRTTTAYGTLEQWVYGIGCYLYFEGNKLTGIQN